MKKNTIKTKTDLIAFIIGVLFIFFLISFSIFIIIAIKIRIKETVDYANGCDYDYSVEEFKTKIYPELKTELLLYFEENMSVSLEDENTENTSFYLKNDNCLAYFNFDAINQACLFTMSANFYSDTFDLSFFENVILKFDNALTCFGKKHFYDMNIDRSILLDIYEGEKGNSKKIHFDHGFGRIGVSYVVRDGELKDEYGIFGYELSILLQNC